MEKIPHSERLKEINLFGLSKRLRSDLITACKCLHGEKILGIKGLFNLAEKGITRTNSRKSKTGKFKRESEHKFLIRRVITH